VTSRYDRSSLQTLFKQDFILFWVLIVFEKSRRVLITICYDRFILSENHKLVFIIIIIPSYKESKKIFNKRKKKGRERESDFVMNKWIT